MARGASKSRTKPKATKPSEDVNPPNNYDNLSRIGRACGRSKRTNGKCTYQSSKTGRYSCGFSNLDNKNPSFIHDDLMCRVSTAIYELGLVKRELVTNLAYARVPEEFRATHKHLTMISRLLDGDNINVVPFDRQ